MGALAALLAEPSAVSSDEAALEGVAAAPASTVDAGAGSNGAGDFPPGASPVAASIAPVIPVRHAGTVDVSAVHAADNGRSARPAGAAVQSDAPFEDDAPTPELASATGADAARAEVRGPEDEAPFEQTAPGQAAPALAADDDAGDAAAQNGVGPLVLPSDSSAAPGARLDESFGNSFLRCIAEAPGISSGADAEKTVPKGAHPEDAALMPLPGPDEADTRAGAPESGSRAPAAPAPARAAQDRAAFLRGFDLARTDQPPSAHAARDRPPAAAGGDLFDEALLQGIAGTPSVSSAQADAAEAAAAPSGRGAHPEAEPVAPPESEPELAFDDPAFDDSLSYEGSLPSDAPGGDADPGYADIAVEASPPGPAAALAFAADPATEMALRDGLFGFGAAAGERGEPQVWQGGLRAAVAALGEGHSAPLVIVDVDGIPYPAGAIHELAGVCEVGTVVVAVGTDDSARSGRELLLAGVSDYLAKPLTADAVRRVASRAAADAANERPGGCVAGFIGCGGSGATTLATATALLAAERGCYVSVLDLSRSVAAAALALGVEPAAGLDQLLETTESSAPDSKMVEGVCARRSERIEVYAHRWDPTPPAAASQAAVDGLLAALRQRSQLVLVDGLDEPALRFGRSLEVDTRVLVAEPTAGTAARLARMMTVLDAGQSLLFTQNHTRAFKRGSGAQALRSAGVEVEPDVVVPFEPALPEAVNRGWPREKLPRSLRKPMAALTERLLEPHAGAGAAASHPASAPARGA